MLLTSLAEAHCRAQHSACSCRQATAQLQLPHCAQQENCGLLRRYIVKCRICRYTTTRNPDERCKWRLLEGKQFKMALADNLAGTIGERMGAIQYTGSTCTQHPAHTAVFGKQLSRQLRVACLRHCHCLAGMVTQHVRLLKLEQLHWADSTAVPTAHRMHRARVALLILCMIPSLPRTYKLGNC